MTNQGKILLNRGYAETYLNAERHSFLLQKEKL